MRRYQKCFSRLEKMLGLGFKMVKLHCLSSRGQIFIHCLIINKVFSVYWCLDQHFSKFEISCLHYLCHKRLITMSIILDIRFSLLLIIRIAIVHEKSRMGRALPKIKTWDLPLHLSHRFWIAKQWLGPTSVFKCANKLYIHLITIKWAISHIF